MWAARGGRGLREATHRVLLQLVGDARAHRVQLRDQAGVLDLQLLLLGPEVVDLSAQRFDRVRVAASDAGCAIGETGLRSRRWW